MRPTLLIRLISPDMSNYSEMMWDHVLPENHVMRKKTKSKTTSNTAGSNQQDLVESLHNEFRLNQEAAQSAYKVMKEKDRTIINDFFKTEKDWLIIRWIKLSRIIVLY